MPSSSMDLKRAEPGAEFEEDVPSLERLRWMLQHDGFASDAFDPATANEAVRPRHGMGGRLDVSPRVRGGLMMLAIALAGACAFANSTDPAVPRVASGDRASKLADLGRLVAATAPASAAMPLTPRSLAWGAMTPAPWADRAWPEAFRALIESPGFWSIPGRKSAKRAESDSRPEETSAAAAQQPSNSAKRAADLAPRLHRAAQVARRLHVRRARRSWRTVESPRSTYWGPPTYSGSRFGEGVSYYFVRGSARSY